MNYNDDSSSKGPSHNGFHNYGATCYLNSLLQSIFHIPEARYILYRVLGSLDTKAVEERKIHDPCPEQVVQALRDLFITTDFASKGQYSVGIPTKPFLEALRWSSNQYGEQQDAGEFYKQVLDFIDRVAGMTTQPAVLKELYSKTFETRFDNVLIKNCGCAPSINHDISTDIALNINSNIFRSCADYLAMDILDGSNMYHCDDCNKRTAAKKGMLIQETPEVLPMTLKRFDFDPMSGELSKDFRGCAFPLFMDTGAFIHRQRTAYTLNDLKEERIAFRPDPLLYNELSASDSELMMNFTPSIENHPNEFQSLAKRYPIGFESKNYDSFRQPKAVTKPICENDYEYYEYNMMPWLINNFYEDSQNLFDLPKEMLGTSAKFIKDQTEIVKEEMKKKIKAPYKSDKKGKFSISSLINIFSNDEDVKSIMGSDSLSTEVNYEPAIPYNVPKNYGPDAKLLHRTIELGRQTGKRFAKYFTMPKLNYTDEASIPDTLYALTAVLVHQGRFNSGHYFAYCADPDSVTIIDPERPYDIMPAKWYCYNDDTVTYVPEIAQELSTMFGNYIHNLSVENQMIMDNDYNAKMEFLSKQNSSEQRNATEEANNEAIAAAEENKQEKDKNGGNDEDMSEFINSRANKIAEKKQKKKQKHGITAYILFYRRVKSWYVPRIITSYGKILANLYFNENRKIYVTENSLYMKLILRYKQIKFTRALLNFCEDTEQHKTLMVENIDKEITKKNKSVVTELDLNDTEWLRIFLPYSVLANSRNQELRMQREMNRIKVNFYTNMHYELPENMRDEFDVYSICEKYVTSQLEVIKNEQKALLASAGLIVNKNNDNDNQVLLPTDMDIMLMESMQVRVNMEDIIREEFLTQLGIKNTKKEEITKERSITGGCNNCKIIEEEDKKVLEPETEKKIINTNKSTDANDTNDNLPNIAEFHNMSEPIKTFVSRDSKIVDIMNILTSILDSKKMLPKQSLINECGFKLWLMVSPSTKKNSVAIDIARKEYINDCVKIQNEAKNEYKPKRNQTPEEILLEQQKLTEQKLKERKEELHLYLTDDNPSQFSRILLYEYNPVKKCKNKFNESTGFITALEQLLFYISKRSFEVSLFLELIPSTKLLSIYGNHTYTPFIQDAFYIRPIQIGLKLEEASAKKANIENIISEEEVYTLQYNHPKIVEICDNALEENTPLYVNPTEQMHCLAECPILPLEKYKPREMCHNILTYNKFAGDSNKYVINNDATILEMKRTIARSYIADKIAKAINANKGSLDITVNASDKRVYEDLVKSIFYCNNDPSSDDELASIGRLIYAFSYKQNPDRSFCIDEISRNSTIYENIIADDLPLQFISNKSPKTRVWVMEDFSLLLLGKDSLVTGSTIFFEVTPEVEIYVENKITNCLDDILSLAEKVFKNEKTSMIETISLSDTPVNENKTNLNTLEEIKKTENIDEEWTNEDDEGEWTNEDEENELQKEEPISEKTKEETESTKKEEIKILEQEKTLDYIPNELLEGLQKVSLENIYAYGKQKYITETKTYKYTNINRAVQFICASLVGLCGKIQQIYTDTKKDIYSIIDLYSPTSKTPIQLDKLSSQEIEFLTKYIIISKLLFEGYTTSEQIDSAIATVLPSYNKKLLTQIDGFITKTTAVKNIIQEASSRLAIVSNISKVIKSRLGMIQIYFVMKDNEVETIRLSGTTTVTKIMTEVIPKFSQCFMPITVARLVWKEYRNGSDYCVSRGSLVLPQNNFVQGITEPPLYPNKFQVMTIEEKKEFIRTSSKQIMIDGVMTVNELLQCYQEVNRDCYEFLSANGKYNMKNINLNQNGKEYEFDYGYGYSNLYAAHARCIPPSVLVNAAKGITFDFDKSIVLYQENGPVNFKTLILRDIKKSSLALCLNLAMSNKEIKAKMIDYLKFHKIDTDNLIRYEPIFEQLDGSAYKIEKISEEYLERPHTAISVRILEHGPITNISTAFESLLDRFPNVYIYDKVIDVVRRIFKSNFVHKHNEWFVRSTIRRYIKRFYGCDLKDVVDLASIEEKWSQQLELIAKSDSIEDRFNQEVPVEYASKAEDYLGDLNIWTDLRFYVRDNRFRERIDNSNSRQAPNGSLTNNLHMLIQPNWPDEFLLKINSITVPSYSVGKSIRYALIENQLKIKEYQILNQKSSKKSNSNQAFVLELAEKRKIAMEANLSLKNLCSTNNITIPRDIIDGDLDQLKALKIVEEKEMKTPEKLSQNIPDTRHISIEIEKDWVRKYCEHAKSLFKANIASYKEKMAIADSETKRQKYLARCEENENIIELIERECKKMYEDHEYLKSQFLCHIVVCPYNLFIHIFNANRELSDANGWAVRVPVFKFFKETYLTTFDIIKIACLECHSRSTLPDLYPRVSSNRVNDLCGKNPINLKKEEVIFCQYKNNTCEISESSASAIERLEIGLSRDVIRNMINGCNSLDIPAVVLKPGDRIYLYKIQEKIPEIIEKPKEIPPAPENTDINDLLNSVGEPVPNGAAGEMGISDELLYQLQYGN